jgi:hypothetical protein
MIFDIIYIDISPTKNWDLMTVDISYIYSSWGIQTNILRKGALE